MSVLLSLTSHPIILSLTIGSIGLMVGKILNKVVHRLPIMLHSDWRAQCHEFLAEDKKQKADTTERFKYPLVEAASAIATVYVILHFGISFQALFATLFTWVLICLCFIDVKHQILPDNVTLPLLWAGLIINVFQVFTDLESAVLGACFGYISLWSIAYIFKTITKKEGMGHGDFKLFAAIGAWLGWQIMPSIILVASLTGALVGICMVLFQGKDKQTPFPFGPYLAFAGWLAIVIG